MPQPSTYLLPQNPQAVPNPDNTDNTELQPIDVQIQLGGEVSLKKPSVTHIYFSKLTTGAWLGKNKDNTYTLLLRTPNATRNLRQEFDQLDPQNGDTFVLVFREQGNIYQLQFTYVGLENNHPRDNGRLDLIFTLLTEAEVTVYNTKADPPELSTGGSLTLDQGYLYKLPGLTGVKTSG